MKTNLVRNLAALVAVILFLSACSGAATPDAAAIATSAVQTVEARYTQEAVQIVVDETPAPTLANTPTLTPKASPLPAATSTRQPVDSNGRPCYAAVFLADVTIPDGMIVAPGSAFTKTWRIKNIGNCVWDQTYSLVLDSGDAMGTVVSVPLTTAVHPDQSVDLTVDLTAPDTNGEYTGYWRIATPFGGTFGVGINDQSLIVKINVTDKPNRDAGVSGIDIGLYQRTPAQGCNAKGAAYTFSATITANSAVNVTYHWMRNPDDGSKPEGGRLNFAAAGSKTVNFTWSFQPEAVQDIDRWVALAIDNPVPQISERIHFTFTCEQ
jgi:hypothetical protein